MDWVSRRTIALLAQKRFFQNWHRRLPKAVRTQVDAIRKAGTLTEDDDIENEVAARLRLVPLKTEKMRAILIEVDERFRDTENGPVGEGYHMEAIVPYTGSAPLWRAAAPHPYSNLTFEGTVGWGEVHVHFHLREKDFKLAERAVTLPIIDLGIAVEQSYSRVADFAEQEEPRLREIVREYLAYIRQLQEDLRRT